MLYCPGNLRPVKARRRKPEPAADPKTMASSGPPKTLLNIALAENARLLDENARLRKLLAERQETHAPPDAAPQAPASVKPLARREQELRKIALFRSLFRGREDVYAIRWQGRDGKSGYAPAAIQDWDALTRCAPEPPTTF